VIRAFLRMGPVFCWGRIGDNREKKSNKLRSVWASVPMSMPPRGPWVVWLVVGCLEKQGGLFISAAAPPGSIDRPQEGAFAGLRWFGRAVRAEGWEKAETGN